VSAVLLIHGFGGGKWEYQILARAFYLQGVKTYQFTYQEKFGSVSLVKIAKKLANYMEKRRNEAKIVTVGLSQGGIIAAYWLEFLGGKKYCDSCWTICTPFSGSLLSYLLPLPGLVELRPESDLLQSLKQAMATSCVSYLGIWNPLDLFVFPGTSARCASQKASYLVLAPSHPLTFWMPRTIKLVCQGVRKN